MKCICKVSVYKTRPERIVCDRPGVLYNVTGILCGVGDLSLCTVHARRLRNIGLKVEKCTPLEQLAGKAERQRAKGLRTIAKPGEPGWADIPGATGASDGR